MTETFSFRSRIPEWVGGREGVLTAARELLKTYPSTLPTSVTKFSPGQLVEDVRQIVLTAIKQKIRSPLLEALTEHLGSIEEIYVLGAGEPDGSNDTWLKGLHDLQYESLAVEVENTLTPEKLNEICYGEDSVEDLVDAMLAQGQDSEKAFALVGVEDADIDALIEEVRGHVEARAGAVSEKTAEIVNQPEVVETTRKPRRNKEKYTAEAVAAFIAATQDFLDIGEDVARVGIVAALAVVGR